jgi:hypothetical protein
MEHLGRNGWRTADAARLLAVTIQAIAKKMLSAPASNPRFYLKALERDAGEQWAAWVG